MREMRQRDRERRHRDGKSRPKKIDIIDQLDATSIYGTGCKVACFKRGSACTDLVCS